MRCGGGIGFGWRKRERERERDRKGERGRALLCLSDRERKNEREKERERELCSRRRRFFFLLLAFSFKVNRSRPTAASSPSNEISGALSETRPIMKSSSKVMKSDTFSSISSLESSWSRRGDRPLARSQLLFSFAALFYFSVFLSEESFF